MEEKKDLNVNTEIGRTIPDAITNPTAAIEKLQQIVIELEKRVSALEDCWNGR